MTPTPLAEVVSRERPTLFERPTWTAESAAGRLFAAVDEAASLRHCSELAERHLGDFARVLSLFTERERLRATLLLALVDAIFDVAGMPVPVAERVENLNRIAFQVARALRGEATEAAFFRLFAGEARRRSFTRPALDELFAAARVAARSPRPETSADLDVRAHQLGEAIATALLGAEPTAAVVDLAAGLIRLTRLQALPMQISRSPQRGCWLPLAELPEPLQYRSDDELADAVTRECVALHHLLLKGARAAAEVPLTFRRPVAFALPVAIALLGLLEERPRTVARTFRHVGIWKLRAAHWRARYTPLG